MTVKIEARPAVALKLSADRKVAPISKWSRGNARWEPRVHNSLGLPAVASCPGSTPACEAVCYAARLPWPSVHRLLAHNLEALTAAETELGMVDLLDEAVCTFRGQCRKWNAPERFRVHWSGDYWGPEYVSAWARVIDAHREVRFWSYTRTLTDWCLGTLAGAPNHALYLSADEDNRDAVDTAARVYGLPIATMADEYPARVDGRRRHVPCPVDRGSMPLVSEQGVGACVACGLCLDGNRDIWFPTR